MSNLNDIIIGLKIIADAAAQGSESIAMEHDVIFAGATGLHITDPEKLAVLEAAGWHQDNEEPDTWYHYAHLS